MPKNSPEYMKARRNRLIAQGLCAKCATNKPAEGKVTCDDCLTTLKGIRDARKGTGVCTTVSCKNPVPEGRSTCPSCVERCMRSHLRIRAEVLATYGGRCKCCNEDHIEFLHLDHVENDGYLHRQQVKGNIYRWARKNGYPKNLQVLCANCNLAKAFYGRCPHEFTKPPSEK